MNAQDMTLSRPAASGEVGTIASADAGHDDEWARAKELEEFMKSPESCGAMPLSMGGPTVCGMRPAGDRGTCIGPYANEDAPDEIIDLLAWVGRSDDGLPICARLTGLSPEAFAAGLKTLRVRKREMHGSCGDRHCGQRRCELHVAPASGPPVEITFEQSGGTILHLRCSHAGKRSGSAVEGRRAREALSTKE